MSDSDERHDATQSGSARKRIIKRYSNRKLYDTRESKYVTLLEIADLIRAGEEVQVIDNSTKEDKTEVTLALIISEELKTQPRDIPLVALRSLIRERGGKWLNQLREGPIGKLMPKDAEMDVLEEAEVEVAPVRAPDEQGKEPPTKGIRATLEQWQSAIDERVRTLIPPGSSLAEIQQEMARLSDRIAALEANQRDSSNATSDEEQPKQGS